MPDLKRVIARLEKHYGKPEPPLTRDPFEIILLEKSGYLCSDERRESAFRELKKRVGTTPAKILATPAEVLQQITAIGGIYADVRALRMHQSATLVRDEFAGDLRPVLKLDFKAARKAFSKFPMIGEPGAEKILLFAGAHARLALESNGLRVVIRLGFGEEHKNYSTMYRRAQEALPIEGLSCEKLIAAHQLLRRHGQEICRRTDPACPACPLLPDCPFAARFA
jgi:endonuclease-3